MDEAGNCCSERDLVRSLGWKIYENIVCNPFEDRWMVFLVRDDQRILARAPELEDAWRLAADQVEQLDEHGI